MCSTPQSNSPNVSEPDWMADIRAAVTRIEAIRLAARSQRDEEWGVEFESKRTES